MAYSKVTVSTEGEVKSSDINQISDNIEYSPRSPATGLKIARGQGSASFSSSSEATATITFSSDSDDGNPAFSAAPRVLLTGFDSPFGEFITVLDSAPSSTGFTARLIESSGASISGDVPFQWFAIGAG